MQEEEAEEEEDEECGQCVGSRKKWNTHKWQIFAKSLSLAVHKANCSAACSQSNIVLINDPLCECEWARFQCLSSRNN